MLKRKLFRDMRQNFSSFLAIFLMVFLGVFAYSGILAYGTGMQISADRFYADCNLQDLWVTGENFTKEDLETIQSLDGVENAERLLTVNTNVKEYDELIFETNFLESNQISKMHVVEGEGFLTGKKGLWIDSYIAKNRGIKVGDTLTLQYESYEISAPVLGLVMTPDHVYFVQDSTAIFPTHDKYGICYLSAEFFPADACMFPSIYVDASKGADLDALKEEIYSHVKHAVAVTDRGENASVECYQSEVDEGASYSGIFSGLFLLIAAISVVTTMNRFVKRQRTQIGTLKALGFGRRKIQFHYISYGFFLSLVGSALGLILGRFTMGTFFVRMEQEYFEVPDMQAATPFRVYCVAVGVVALITIVAFLSCHKMLREPASQALRLEAPKGNKKGIKISKISSRFSIGVRWNIRDVFETKDGRW